MERLEVSYVYDPLEKKLECNVEYNGRTDSFCCMFDAPPTHEFLYSFVNGFVQYLIDKVSTEERK